MSEITREAFSKAMHDAVEERGADWIYPEAAEDDELRRANAPEWYTALGMCRYRLRDGSPACIVGAALGKLGRLDDVEINSWDGAFTLLTNLGVDEATALAADRAQSVQDQGKSWGHALIAFEGRLAQAAS